MSKEKQIEETYELIMSAFLILLKEKPYAEITLTEIANNAGVARMTLYRHFKSKEQILVYRAKMQTDLFKQTVENNSLSLEELVNSFLIFYKNLPLSNLITIDANINAVFYPYILELRAILYSSLKNTYPTKFNDYTYNFILGGLNAIMFNWCKTNFKEDTVFLTNIIMTFIAMLK